MKYQEGGVAQDNTRVQKPQIIDFNLQSVPEWITQGFKLRKGGKIENNS